MQEENEKINIEPQELNTQLAQQKEMYLRIIAEYENKMSRNKKDATHAISSAIESIVLDLMPLTSDLRKAIETCTQEDRIGLELIEKNVLSILKKHGINMIEPKIGEMFDPYLHQALGYDENSSNAEGTISKIIQHGYSFDSKVIAPAIVIVAAAQTNE